MPESLSSSHAPDSFDGQEEPSLPRERYGPGYSEGVQRWMQQRRAAAHASFLLPHLHAGMSLLDAGCGPGSITLDLTEIVAPAEVIGLDIEPRQIERAQALARARGISNARFLVGDIYALPFAEATFAVVFAHAVL
jgi:ubiquinone/menaquinone biosynthesis C-methylase UbiE